MQEVNLPANCPACGGTTKNGVLAGTRSTCKFCGGDVLTGAQGNMSYSVTTDKPIRPARNTTPKMRHIVLMVLGAGSFGLMMATGVGRSKLVVLSVICFVMGLLQYVFSDEGWFD